MLASRFDTIMSKVGIPALQRVLGIPAIHTNAALDETELTVIAESGLMAVGDFGERMEPRTTLKIPTSAGVMIGDTLTIANPPTADDPYPDATSWQVVQIMADDGLLQTFAVIVLP